MFKINKYPIGLDISDTSLRLVQLKKGGKFKLSNKIQVAKEDINCYNNIEIPEGLIVNGEIQDQEKIVGHIKNLILTTKGGKVYGNETVAVLPTSQTFIKLIKIITTQETELEQIIPEEISKHFPIQIEDYYIDWQIIKQDNEKIEILVGVAPKKIVNQYTEVLEQALLQPTTLEIEANAIHRCLTSEIISKDKNTTVVDENFLIIDLGASRNSIIACSNKTTYLTVDAPISGDIMTKKIAETLSLTNKQAEKVKKVCGLNKNNCKGAVREILDEEVDKLIEYIKKTMSFFNTNHPDKKLTKIFLCGGGSDFIDIDKVLFEKLQIPVEKGNPWGKINQNDNNTFQPINKHSLSYTTAMGLALREQ